MIRKAVPVCSLDPDESRSDYAQMIRKAVPVWPLVLTIGMAACGVSGVEEKGANQIAFQRRGEVFLVNGNASGLTWYGDYLYMVLNESTHPLVVYDIRKPNEPRVVRHLPAPGWPMWYRIVAPNWL